MLEQRLITAINKGGLPPSDESRTLVGHLTQFHRRADKPAFWAMFDRCERELEELMDDVECIGDISPDGDAQGQSSEEHTSELQSLMRFPYTVYCLNKKIHQYH